MNTAVKENQISESPSTDLSFECDHLKLCESVCLSQDRHNVDLVVDSLHKSYVQWLQPADMRVDMVVKSKICGKSLLNDQLLHTSEQHKVKFKFAAFKPNLMCRESRHDKNSGMIDFTQF